MPGVIKSTVRRLRQEQTASEVIVWQLVRNRQFNGYKFFRQHPLRFKYNGWNNFFVADFYCAELKLVLEIDGKIHEKQQERDGMRTFIINQLGIRVVRISNEATQNKDRLHEQLKLLIP